MNAHNSTENLNDVLIFKAFDYRGSEVPGIPNIREMAMPSYLVDGIDPSKPLKPAYVHAAESSPLLWTGVLYDVGRDFKLGVKDAGDLPGTVQKAGIAVHDHFHRGGPWKMKGGFHRDAAMLLPKNETPKGMKQMDGPYRLARYFRNIAGLKRQGQKWEVVRSSSTRIGYVWLPEMAENENYIVPTTCGTHDPFSGTPLKLKDRGQAEIDWRITGLKPEEAVLELAKFTLRSSLDHEIVIPCSYYDRNGARNIAFTNPENSFSWLGHYPVELHEGFEPPRLLQKERDCLNVGISILKSKYPDSPEP